MVPFNGGIATPVCALARNDSIFSNTNLSFLCITRRNNVPSRVPGGDVGVRIYFAGEAERSVTSW